MNKPDLHLLESTQLPYLVSVPRNNPPENGWPLIFFLHGYDEGAPLQIHTALTANGPLSSQSSPRATADFLIAAPQLRTRGDIWERFADDVLEIKSEVTQTFQIDSSKSYLTGFSFGGNGVFDLGIRQPDTWAALWAVDPTRVPRQKINKPIWLSSGSASRHKGQSFMKTLDLHVLENSEVPSERVYLDRKLDHVGTAAQAYGDDRIYQWLLQKSLK
ncbi:MAG: hypothetical protein ACLFQB_12250 [Chitinispirillaceae bacterium]